MVKCGASGHNVRSEPNLRAPPVGMLVLGNHITVLNHVSAQRYLKLGKLTRLRENSKFSG